MFLFFCDKTRQPTMREKNCTFVKNLITFDIQLAKSRPSASRKIFLRFLTKSVFTLVFQAQPLRTTRKNVRSLVPLPPFHDKFNSPSKETRCRVTGSQSRPTSPSYRSVYSKLVSTTFSTLSLVVRRSAHRLRLCPVRCWGQSDKRFNFRPPFATPKGL